MGYSLIASTAKGATGGASVTTDEINTSGADLIVIAVSFYSNINPSITVSDSKSNTWTLVDQWGNFASEENLAMYYAEAPTVGSGHTFTEVEDNGFAYLMVQAWSGSVASPLDQFTGAHTDSATSLQPGSITPGEDHELIVSALAMRTDTSTPTVNSGLTVSDAAGVSGGNYLGGGMAYLVQGSAAAINPTWSWGGASSASAGIASFKAASGGTVIPVFMRQYRQRWN